jgi:hypothetical protein
MKGYTISIEREIKLKPMLLRQNLIDLLKLLPRKMANRSPKLWKRVVLSLPHRHIGPEQPNLSKTPGKILIERPSPTELGP